MNELTARDYYSHSVKIETQGLTLANFALFILTRLRMFSGVFRQEPFLVASFRNGQPSGPAMDTASMEQFCATGTGMAGTIQYPEFGALLVYIAEPEFLEPTIEASRPSAVFSIAQDGPSFEVTAHLSPQVCPDRIFLRYVLDSLTNLSASAPMQSGPAPLEDAPQENSSDYFVARFHKMIARSKGEETAIYSEQGNLSYASLWSLSNRLASDFIRRGAVKGDRMMILATRSVELVVVLMAAMKAGIAFSLMDAKLPDDYILECAQIVAPAFLVDLAGRRITLGLPLKHAYSQLSLEQMEVLPEDKEYTTDVLAHDDLVAITFTSGTTGGPKAVMGRYGSLTYFFNWMSTRFGPFLGYRFGMCSSLSHDPLQRDIFTPIYCGGSICIPKNDDITTPGKLQAWMAASSVNSACLTPPLLSFMSEDGPQLPNLSAVFFVGAALSREHVVKLRRIAPSARIVNTYGSTESQRAVSYFELPSLASELQAVPEVVPIGRGMKDVDILVWNTEARRRCYAYELGEIVIRSRNIALGYMNAPEMAYRFRSQILGEDDSSPAYMSGDYGYYSLEYGAIFVGRIDSQQKINGHRVDLEQISSICRRCAPVSEAVTIIADMDGSPGLVTFLVPRDKVVTFDATEFRAYLAEKLPSYMLPVRIETISAIPLTRHNKIDMRRLKEMVGTPSDSGHSYASGDSVAAFVTDFVRSRLGHSRIDSHSTLEELGVDSVSFVDLITRLQKRFSMQTAGLILHNSLTTSALAVLLKQGVRHGGSTAIVSSDQQAAAYNFGAASRVTTTCIDFPDRVLSHFCSNSYLGLGEHPELRSRLVEFVSSNPSLASHGSMLVNGKMDFHKRVEARVSNLYECETAILYSSCYLANLSAISGLAGPGDQIIADEMCHRSLRDGCSISGADVAYFAHNDPVSLEARLQSHGSRGGRKLIVTEAVFSIEGDIINLPAISALAKKYDAILLVDEACSLGQLGPYGRGSEEHYGLSGAIDVRTGSLSKAIPSMGGYVAFTDEISKEMRFGQGAVFSTAISPIQAFLAAEALQILDRDGADLVGRLHRNADTWKAGLRACGFDIGLSETAITCVRLANQDMVQPMFAHLIEQGIYTLPITRLWDTHTFGIRTSVTAAHELADIESAIERFGNFRLESSSSMEAVAM